MPVNSTHPDYDVAAADWIRARDVLAGEDAVKAADEKYLPRIEAQTYPEYVAYRQRASFFNATARTAEGYIGLIFRRPPFIKLPEAANGRDAFHTHGKNAFHSVPHQNAGKDAVPGVPNQNRKFRDAVERVPTSLGKVTDTVPMDRDSIPRVPTSLGIALSNFVADADLMGTSLAAYSKNVVSEVVGVGRAGSLIDWEGEFEQRAYVSLYSAEQIINWRVERVNGRSIPTLIVLRERAKRATAREESAESDPFVADTIDQIRVLRLVPHPSSPHPASRIQHPESSPSPVTRHSSLICLVEIWQPKVTNGRHAKPEWQLVETRVPLRLGKPLPLIPFVFHGPRHSRPNIDKPPLNDIIAVNLDHYRLDADFKHGLHYTALPTAWVSGFEKSARLRIGSTTAWVAETPGATAGFLEFSGQGLTSFERAMDRDERLMAVLGSRLLEDQKKVGETAEAIELRQSGENSILTSIAASLSESLTQVLRWVHWWNSTDELPDEVSENQVLLKLNTDFSLKGMSSDELKAIVSAWQAGAISRDTMLELFRKGEILPDGRTNEEEVRRVMTNRGPLSNGA